MELVLPVGPGTAPNQRQRVVDIYVVVNNIVQMKEGDIIRALR